jgi:hypothetical protein
MCVLQNLVNILLVAPERLAELVDNTLKLSHAQALTYAQLRQDFWTARIGEKGDKTLAGLFPVTIQI